ncbi:hypothetical protein GDO86_001967 [Hymenochirus boettgeri]|uniref:E1A-binding protein p400 n=1 Tax=Hymenochirus boettgeri TaxID=247094 RepID=A0A8T2KEV9_9PIPI|nr:hypothetical protein GDO86_001967 [Hymenochirus boettgeri]
MLHGRNPQDSQLVPKQNSGNGGQQMTQKTTPQSPVPSFTPTVTSPAPQSPSYQIQHLIMSRNPVAGQNVNIALQNVGPVVAGSQQITLTSLPISNPASPGFQFSTQPRRFEQGSPSYIQVTSPVSQQVQTQSSTQQNTVPIQALQSVRTGSSSASLGVCSPNPSQSYMDAGLLVRQLSLGASNAGTFVFQEGSGMAQIAQGAQVHLSSGTPTVPAHNLLHANSQAIGPVHQFASQSSVAGSVNVQSSTSSHITTTNLTQQLSSIIQGQLIQQQQQVLHGQPISRTISFDRTATGMIAGVAEASAFGIITTPAPLSPSLAVGPQAVSSLPISAQMVSTLKKQTRKLEEIPPASPEDALMRKLCLDHYHQQMQILKENFTEYLIELFFLQHVQGNMMDYLLFKKKRNIYQNFLRQNDLDLEVQEEEGEKNPSQIIHTQKPLVALGVTLVPSTTCQTGNDGSFSSAQQMTTPLVNRQNDLARVCLEQNAANLQSTCQIQLSRAPFSSIHSPMHLTQQQPIITESQSKVKAKQQSPGTVSQPASQNQNLQHSQIKLLDQPSSIKHTTVQATLSKGGGPDTVKTTIPIGQSYSPSLSTTPSIPDSVPSVVAVSPKRMLSPCPSKTLSPSHSPGSAIHSQETQNLAQVSAEPPQEIFQKPVEQESQIHQRITELRKEGLWSPRRLPKLQEPSRSKSHWDYLLEEMSWMAADFAQERMWKLACAKKLVRTAVRHCQEKQQNDARAKKENEDRLRRIAWLAAKEIQYFWANIEQRELRRKRQQWDEPNNFNVCITSYKQLFKGHNAFMKMRWKYLVLDEIHQLKSMTEKHWEAILNLRSQRRLLLRDTPLPHTWKELWTMVHFLIPGLSRPYLDFPVNDNDQDQDYKHTISIRLHRSTQPFILRRSKRDVERQLTKKSEHILKCHLSNRQRALYEDVMMQPGTQDALKGGHFVRVLHVLMQLQRICNHPDLVDQRPTHSSYVFKALQYKIASLILRALEYDLWQNVDLSLFNLLGVENKITRYEAQVLPKKKVTRKLIQEIYSSPDPPPRPSHVKIKPSRLFETVLYGQKPEGRTVGLLNAVPTRTMTATTATVTQQGQVRRSPITTPATSPAIKAPTAQGQSSHVQVGATRPQAPASFATAAPVRQLNQPSQQNVLSPRLVLSSQARLPTGEVVKIAQLASTGGVQGRVAQPETPVTLQFQGNKFTLSQSQLRQLTAGHPLQLQGNVLQIVSAPGQYLRPQGSVVLPTMPQGTTTNVVRSQQPVGAPVPSTGPSTVQALVLGRSAQTFSQASDPVTKTTQAVCPAQESAEEKQRVIRDRLDRLFYSNEKRCARVPIYGEDLISFCFLNSAGAKPLKSSTVWGWTGSVNCLVSSQYSENSGDLLQYLILSPEQQKAALQPLTKSALCVVPSVIAAPPVLSVSRPPLTFIHGLKTLHHNLKKEVTPKIHQLREQTSPSCLPFPDIKLIQLDSGKLDALAVLLRKLKSEGRRVLIFSQMLLMLDILEMFLDFHCLTFLRIDESARSEQCRDLMKTFNRDSRIFCVLLSTHIPSLGVHQVEADTMIFYDSDLNPVMEGKTQSWCDLVSRSRDIHVYRLVSANSIEEKLLRNGTKDLIREVAAQGSDYSLAFLTQQTIQELFEVCSPMEDSGVKAEEFVLLSQEPSPSDTITPKVAKPFVEALVEIESIKEISEPVQEGLESSTGISLADGSDPFDLPEPSQFEELFELMQQLTPIEKYALHYLELFHVRGADAHDEYTEEKLQAAKREWDSQHLRTLREREEKMQWEAEEEELFTYTREDAYNMDFIYDGPNGQTEIMPIWTPPTPPQDENDIYIDSVMCLMYDTNPIPESKLPPVYTRKERKRHKTDPAAAGRKKKMRHGESVVPPRSLFDRAAQNTLKVRKEGKEQKKNIIWKPQTQFAKPLPTLIKPVMETGPENPEWLISEDWALLQAVKQLLELPLNLSVVSPAHTPNWDLVSDVVNSCSRIYRSSKQCRTRYENVIIPREEGKLLYDVSPKKKSENIFKTKPLRTSQIYAQDEGMTHSTLFATRFELMKLIAGKRSQPSKPVLGGNPFQKNPKHASVLAESGINYDKPLPPIQVASLRADRIAKEKKALVEQARAQQQSGPSPQPPQQNGQPPTQAAAQPTLAQTQPLAITPSQVVVQQQPTTKALNTSTAPISTPALLTGTIKTAVPGTSIATGTVSGNMVVNNVSGVSPASFQTINKRLVSPVVTGTVSASPAATAQIVQQRTPVSTTLPTEMVTIATSQVRAVTPVTGGAVVSTNLTPVQTQTRAIVTQVSTATTGGVQLAGKTITQAQFQLLRQQQAQVQVPQIQTQTQSSGQIKAVAKMSQEQLLKLQKQKLQHAAQAGALTGTTAQVQVQPQQTQQLATVTASRAGAVLASTTMTNLQVARLLQAQGQIQAQSGQTAQVALAKPPVVSAVVSPGGVTTLPVTVAGISVSINQSQKAAGQTVVAQPLHVQPLLKLKHHPTPQQQKTLQSQSALGQQKPYLSLQITTPQVSTASQQQKVTYTTQPGIKTQFLTSLTQAQKTTGTQQVQAQIQVAKIPQVVQQSAAIATLQQVVPASQQVPTQTVTLTQATATGQPQVQVIPAQVVQQKLLHPQVIAAAAPTQIQTPDGQSTASGLVTSDTQNQQAKLQIRTPTVRIKAPTKPS